MVHLAAKDGTAMPPLEKPQQILPCPRCESMNTKFCYFNNYSVNQPRHFCKQCQRYWTVGGTLRNVPVGGASRKKNRHPTSPQDQHPQQQPYMRSSAPPHPGQLQPVFQQMLTHDMSGPGFNFSQLPGFVPHSQEMHVQQPFSSTPAPQEFVPPLGSVSSNYNYFQEPGSVLHGEHNGVKPEFWSSGHMQVDSGSVQTGSKSGGYDSSMLLHMGLNSRPLMEEERSVPGNGYSNGGFQEGDTVSGSMWHGVQDMQEFYR